MNQTTLVAEFGATYYSYYLKCVNSDSLKSTSSEELFMFRIGLH